MRVDSLLLVTQNIAGKAVTGASEKSKGEKPVYHPNAMYEGGVFGVERKRVGKKENEMSCLPDYLKQFELSDKIVTMDAIRCNQTIIRAIQKGGRELCTTGKGKPEKTL